MSREQLLVLVGEQAKQIAALTAMNEELADEAGPAGAPAVAQLRQLLDAAVAGRRSGQDAAGGEEAAVVGRSGPRASSRARRARTWPGSSGPMTSGSVPARAAASAGTTWPTRPTWGWSTATSSTRSRRSASKVTQYDQHAVRCGCGRVHTAHPPGGRPAGPVGYGPNLQAFAVYLMVVHSSRAQRCVELLESLTGATPSAGFVHGMLTRAAGLLTRGGQADPRPDHPGLRGAAATRPRCGSGRRQPKPGRKKAEKYLLVACTELYTHYLLGDRDLDTFKAFVLTDLTGSVVVHDRYQLYDSAELGQLIHQLCCQHLLRDLDGAGEVYPDALWPTQIADALRGADPRSQPRPRQPAATRSTTPSRTS